MSLAQALSTAVSGLRTTQTSLSLVASNVANAQTPGYVRKTLSPETTAAGANGVSVRVGEVARELDQYVQRQLRTEAAGGAYADLRAEFYARLQLTYGAPGSTTSLETSLNQFTQALQSLSTNPDDISVRTAVLGAAQVLTQNLNGMTQSIQGLRADAEVTLSASVTQANDAMRRISEINRQLATSTSQDATTASLLDQRDLYIDQLGQLMDIRAVAGDNRQVTIFTNSGVQLVGTQASQLAFDGRGTVTAASRWSADPARSTLGTLTVVQPSGGAYDLIANRTIRSGQIAALIEMRDQVLVDAQTQLDSLAAGMAQALSSQTVGGAPATVGAQAGFDFDTAGLLAGNSIQLTVADNSGGKRTFTLVRVDDPAALPLSDKATNASGDTVIGVDFSAGMGSVVAQLNQRFSGKLAFSNPSGNTLRVLDDGAANTTSIQRALITRTVTGLSGVVEAPLFTDSGRPFSGAFTSTGSQSIGFAGRITVNAALLADPSKLVAYQSGTASGDPTRANFFYNQLISAPITFAPGSGIGSASAPFTGTLTGYMRQAISVQGEAAANAASLASGQEVVVNALKKRMSQSAGVDVDTEMAHLVSLQTAYGANARVMSAVRDMLDLLMNV